MTGPQYLLRFDDLCPTMDRSKWQRFLPMLTRYRIQPILAIVPDNRDPDLAAIPPDPSFWPEMRAMQQAGAAIGLHGYRHTCQTKGTSLIPLHRKTEFAGAPLALQREWIQSGIAILRGEGLQPDIWVAPRHGSDRATLQVLIDEGISAVSDGFARQPFAWLGATWIPQQLWQPQHRDQGLWTICLHPATATAQSIEQLERFLSEHGHQFTSVKRVLNEWPTPPRSFADRLFHARLLMRIRASRLKRRLLQVVS